MTPPDDQAIRRDIELTKAMGFNGARKHQKMEDARYYYWANKMGLMVWGMSFRIFLQCRFHSEYRENGQNLWRSATIIPVLSHGFR